MSITKSISIEDVSGECIVTFDEIKKHQWVRIKTYYKQDDTSLYSIISIEDFKTMLKELGLNV